MPFVNSVYQKINFLISKPKHMLWVLKRTVSMRRFFWAPKTYVKADGKDNIYNFIVVTIALATKCAFIITCDTGQLVGWDTPYENRFVTDFQHSQ